MTNATTDDPGFSTFFRHVTGQAPHPWQAALGASPECTDRLLRIPTGFGKTAGAVIPWLYRRVKEGDRRWPTRLLFVLPMRVLAEQTVQAVRGWVARAGLEVPVHLAMGGVDAGDFHLRPEVPAVLVGTQDMWLSRALMRGFASGRARWPVDFGLVHQDTLWVLDEVQLMDVGLATTSQLAALRAKRPSVRPTFSWWMSATLQPSWLATYDAKARTAALASAMVTIPAEARTGPLFDVEKSLAVREDVSAPEEVAALALSLHAQRASSLTLVVANTVVRASAIHEAIEEALVTTTGTGKNKVRTRRADAPDVRLVHSRFRGHERSSWRFLRREACAYDASREAEEGALAKVGRIVVATQVVEAGVDVSARALVTDLAPWPSLVQRFGRCARYAGEEGEVVVVGARGKALEKLAGPYEVPDLEAALATLAKLEGASPRAIEALEAALDASERAALYRYEPFHVLRQADLEQLFDTSQDLSGGDVDPSRFIRSGEERDVTVLWRAMVEPEVFGAGGESEPTDDDAEPDAEPSEGESEDQSDDDAASKAASKPAKAAKPPAAASKPAKAAKAPAKASKAPKAAKGSAHGDGESTEGADGSPDAKGPDAKGPDVKGLDAKGTPRKRARPIELDVQPLPARDELCRVPVGQARAWLGERSRFWLLDYLDGRWRSGTRADARRVSPGDVVLLDAAEGGYTASRGFDAKSKQAVEPLPSARTTSLEDALLRAFDETAASEGSDALSALGWQTIATHGAEVAREAMAMVSALALPPWIGPLVELAARWHDVGKAHPVFQAAIRDEAGRPRDGEGQPRHDLAKAPREAWSRYARPGFRHELASMLALYATVARAKPDHPALTSELSALLAQLEPPEGRPNTPDEARPSPDEAPASAGPLDAEHPLARELVALTAEELDLVAWCVLTHHGKVRCGLASTPADQAAVSERSGDAGRVHGVEAGDVLPATLVATRDGAAELPATHLSLELAALGFGPQFGRSWAERVASLRSAHGPFVLAYLEALLRAADVRASMRVVHDALLEGSTGGGKR